MPTSRCRISISSANCSRRRSVPIRASASPACCRIGADPLKGKVSAGLLAALQAAGLPVTDQALVLETESTSGASASLPHYLRDKQAVCKIVNTGGTDYQVFRLRQTLSSAEELAAAPEYVNADAYAALEGRRVRVHVALRPRSHRGKGLLRPLRHLESGAHASLPGGGHPGR